MKRIAAAFLVLLGCTNIERANQADFFPMSETEFVYRGAGAATDPAAEARRMAWLEEYLLETGMCPDGYRILERKPVFEDGSYVQYHGRCR